jgi:hypothetical protein
MSQYRLTSSAGIREVIGAWLVCLVAAVASYTVLTAEAPRHGSRLEALIGPDPTATLAAAEDHRAKPHRHGRC